MALEPEKLKDVEAFDWSGTGRGCHVNFKPSDALPLTEGRCLGAGANGRVYETTVKGIAVAWKRKYCKKGITEAEKKEIDILKKLRHKHIVQLVGTYSRPPLLGILTYPVAVCDLLTVFEEMEEWNSKGYASAQLPKHLEALKFTSETVCKSNILSIIGCLSTTMVFLHENEIRHKDLKPDNILLTQDGILVTDFDTSTDFSALSSSITNGNERGTPRYRAPEVAISEPRGTKADIFSLGCVLLELMWVVFDSGVSSLRAQFQPENGRYHANLDVIDASVSALISKVRRRSLASTKAAQVLLEVIATLNEDPELRPSAPELVHRLKVLDNLDVTSRLFRQCCASLSHGEMIQELKLRSEEITSLKVELKERIKVMADANAAQKQKHDKAVKLYDGDLRRLNRKIIEMQDLHTAQKNELHQHYENTKAELERTMEKDHTSEMHELQAAHKSKWAELQRCHHLEIQNLKNKQILLEQDHQRSMTETKTLHRNNLRAHERQLQQAMAAQEISSENRLHEKILSHKNSIKKLNDQHKSQIEHLLEEIKIQKSDWIHNEKMLKSEILSSYESEKKKNDELKLLRSEARAAWERIGQLLDGKDSQMEETNKQVASSPSSATEISSPSAPAASNRTTHPDRSKTTNTTTITIPEADKLSSVVAAEAMGSGSESKPTTASANPTSAVNEIKSPISITLPYSPPVYSSPQLDATSKSPPQDKSVTKNGFVDNPTNSNIIISGTSISDVGTSIPHSLPTFSSPAQSPTGYMDRTLQPKSPPPGFTPTEISSARGLTRAATPPHTRRSSVPMATVERTRSVSSTSKGKGLFGLFSTKKEKPKQEAKLERLESIDRQLKRISGDNRISDSGRINRERLRKERRALLLELNPLIEEPQTHFSAHTPNSSPA
jgi:serine/threonine protein kinase